MADANNPTPSSSGNQALGVGNMLSETFGLYFRNLPAFFLIVFIPVLAFELLFNRIIIPGFVDNPADVGAQFLISFGSVVPFMILMILVQAVIVRVAISIRMGQGAAIGAAVSAALRGFFPILLLGIVVGIITGVGFVFLIVPGLYLMAIFYVMVPAIVFENAGFGAMGRSAELTSGYRWPIVGLVLLLLVIMWLVGAVVGGVLIGGMMASGGMEAFASGNPADLPIWYNVLNALISSLATPLSLIAGAVVYSRLKEIKEGAGAGDILKVFE